MLEQLAMNIAFIIDSWSDIEPNSNSTLRMIHEAVSRGYRTAILYPQNLTIRDNVAHGFVKVIELFEKIPLNFATFHQKTTFKEQMLPLRGFDAIVVRKDPPIDNIMLNFLDSISSDVLIINSVEGMRKANNKLYTTAFGDIQGDFLPNTYVSKNKDFLKKIISESEQDKMILKPLNGYGGSGVIVLEKRAKSNISSLLDFYINSNVGKNYVILQEYIEGAENGDIRILLLNGEPIGAMRRVPATDDVRSNVHAGGRVEKHSLSKKELEICRKIKPHLIADGLDFVGIDVINGKLIEVNVLSPGGIVNINRLNKTKLQKKIIDYIEEKVKHRETSFSRRVSFKEIVRNS
jgi:glutathione synthase